MPVLSLVFPIYNNEKYIETCVRSAMNQSFKDLELILIDDGSVDGAPAICDRLALEDSRIRVVHKTNEGSAVGRNLGLELAQGEYVAFIESDDRVDPKMYQTLIETAISTRADIVKCGFWICGSEKKEYTSFYKCAAPGEVFRAVDRPEIFMYHASIWAGLYRRAFVETNHLRFIVTPSATYSDFSWMAMTYACAERIAICHQPLYYYTFDNPWASNKQDGEKCFYKPFHCLQANRILREKGIFARVREEIGCQEYVTCFHHARRIRPELRNEYFVRFREVVMDLTREGDLAMTHFNAAQKKGFRRLYENDCEGFYRFVEKTNRRNAAVSRVKALIRGRIK